MCLYVFCYSLIFILLVYFYSPTKTQDLAPGIPKRDWCVSPFPSSLGNERVRVSAPFFCLSVPPSPSHAPPGSLVRVGLGNLAIPCHRTWERFLQAQPQGLLISRISAVFVAEKIGALRGRGSMPKSGMCR